MEKHRKRRQPVFCVRIKKMRPIDSRIPLKTTPMSMCAPLKYGNMESGQRLASLAFVPRVQPNFAWKEFRIGVSLRLVPGEQRLVQSVRPGCEQRVAAKKTLDIFVLSE